MNAVDPAAGRPGRIPSLDGIRAVSIGLVFTSHLYHSKAVPALGFLWRFQLGDLGVRVFFVISGFLITTLLLKEFARDGSVSLRRFYARRIARIFPAYYTFLAFVAVCSALGLLEVSDIGLARAAAYVSNYFPRPPSIAHTWSLSLEEQFYLLWPGLMIVLGLRRAIVLAVAFTIMAAGLRTAYSFPISNQTNVFWVRFETAGDAVAIGCIFAALRHRLWGFRLYRGVCTPWGTMGAMLVIVWLAASHRWPWFWNAFGITLMDLCIVIVIDGCIRAQKSWHYRLLNSRPVVWVGVLSYSLYLWQQLLLTGIWPIPFPLSLLMTFAAAWLSFEIVEKPCLRWSAQKLRVTKS